MLDDIGTTPATVPGRDPGLARAGETQGSPREQDKRSRRGHDPVRFGWAEPDIWTRRMLAALETGVKGGKRCNWPSTASKPMRALPGWIM